MARQPIGQRGVRLRRGWRLHWNMLSQDVRYLGVLNEWYDGPIYGFGFWFWHVYLMSHYQT